MTGFVCCTVHERDRCVGSKRTPQHDLRADARSIAPAHAVLVLIQVARCSEMVDRPCAVFASVVTS